MLQVRTCSSCYATYATFRFKNLRELFDGYKHKIQQEYGRVAEAASKPETVDVTEAVESSTDDELIHHIICRMTVNNVNVDDCGDIECRAYNAGGVDTTRAVLSVHSKHH